MKLANNTKNHQAAAPSAAVDPGILEMGTSVTVNDELRRTLAAEIQEIDTAVTKLNENISKEESIKGEQVKSKARAENEMASIRQEAAENVEKLTMCEHMFSGFATTFSKEIAVNENDTESKVSDASSIAGVKKAFAKNCDAAANASEAMKKHTTVCRDLMNTKKETTETLGTLLHKIDDSLSGDAKKEQHNTAKAKETLLEEEKRLNTFKANLGVIDARNTANNKTLNELVRTYQLTYLFCCEFVVN